MYSIGVVLYHLHFPQAKGVPPVPGALQLPEGGADSDLTDLIRALLEVGARGQLPSPAIDTETGIMTPTHTRYCLCMRGPGGALPSAHGLERPAAPLLQTGS